MEVVVSRFVSTWVCILGSPPLGRSVLCCCSRLVVPGIYGMSLIIVSNSIDSSHDYSRQIQRVDLRETAETFSTSENEPLH